MACLFIFSSLVIISPWQPKTYAAYESVTFFSTQPGNLTEQSQKEVAKAFDKGDSYKEAGWKDIVVYVKDLMGTGPQKLTFNEDLSKRVACMDNPMSPDECKGRQPSFTTTLFCTPSNQSQPFSPDKPQDVEAYYEIVYAVGLKNNGSKGSEFVNRDDFNGIAGYADVVRYSKSNPELAYYDIEDKTREFSPRDSLTQRHDVDHYNNNDRKSNKKGTFGILDGESICQPSPSFKKDMKMVNYNKIADENEKLAFNPSGAAAGADDDGASAGELSCGMTGALGWFLCPLVDMINNAIGTIDSMITTLLTISPDNFNISCKKDDGGNLDSAACSRAKSYYSAWSSFRTLALGIVIIAALVVIVGSALGYELLDAYTIRKVLPRIIFAIIFIALSWHILSFFVILTNDIGNGARWLIYQPFAEIGAIEIDGSNMGFLTIFGALGIAGGVVSMFIYGPAILTFLLVGLIIMSVAVLIMVLRELIVILLVILAPIGIACYILPNTQKGWQLWQNTITTMLLAFPIIAAIIAFGRVFAATSFAGGEAGPLQQFIGLIAYFIPYFLIPYSFKLAGGAIAGLANIANNAERGVFDRMRNMRQKKAEYNIQRMKDGERFNNKLLNTATARASTSRFGFTKKGRSAYEQKMALGAMRHAKSDAGQAGQFNDDMLQAMTFESSNAAREGLVRSIKEGGFGMSADQAEAAIAAAKANGGFGKNRQYYAAQQLAATGTGYKNQEQVASTIARVSGGNESVIGALAGNINSQTKQVGRHDLAPGAGVLADMARDAAHGGSTNADYSKAWDSADIGSAVRNKGKSMDNFIGRFEKDFTGSSVKRRKAAIAFAELHGSLPNASAENQQKIVASLKRLGIDPTGNVAQQLAARSGGAITEQDIHGEARKYGSSTPAAARGGGAPPGGGPAPGAGGGSSDIRLKKNIQYLCSTSENIRIYSFQYLWSDEVYVGVMAQDLIETHPYALHKDSRGYYMVDYAALGLAMMKYEDWEKQHKTSGTLQ